MQTINWMTQFYKLSKEHNKLIKKVNVKQKKISKDHSEQLQAFKKAKSKFEANN